MAEQLGNYVRIRSGKYLKSSEFRPDGPYKVVGANGQIGRYSQTNVFPPFLTIGRVGSIGSINRFDEPCWVTDNALVISQEDTSLDLKFLELFLRLVEWSELSAGSTQPLINQATVKGLEIDVPSLDQQRSIAAWVTSTNLELNKVSERLITIPALIKKFRQSVLAAACSGQLTVDHRASVSGILRPALDGFIEVPESWNVVPISQVTERLDQGWSPKCLEHPRRHSLNWAVLKTSSIEPMKFVSTAHKELPDSLAPREHLAAKTGDLLITRAGPRSRCAVSCVVRETPDRLMICDKMYRLRLKGMLPEFLEIILNSPSCLELLDDMKTGISDSGLNLTQKGLLAINVPSPATDEQVEIVRRVESLFSLADQIESRLAEATAQVERTTQAILAKAFRGELSGS